LKNKTKEKVLAIMENLAVLEKTPGWTSLKKEHTAAKVSEDIDILETYLKLANYQGWLGGANFLILIKEYHTIQNQLQVAKSQVILKEIISLQKETEEEPMFVLKQEAAQPKEQPTPFNQPIASLKLSGRQSKILEMLEGREKAQVADFVKELSHVTKRTVRRDLDELLKMGKIIRVGEWNQVSYQLNKVRTS
jgi:hypothetical protein